MYNMRKVSIFSKTNILKRSTSFSPPHAYSLSVFQIGTVEYFIEENCLIFVCDMLSASPVPSMHDASTGTHLELNLPGAL